MISKWDFNFISKIDFKIISKIIISKIGPDFKKCAANYISKILLISVT